MKSKLILPLLGVAVALTALPLVSPSVRAATENQSAKSEQQAGAKDKDKKAQPEKAGANKKKAMLRHVVAFKFKESASEDQIKSLVKAFRGLKKKIPQIVSFETGTNNSPEGFNKGCTHGFILTFKSEKDRDDYLVHPDHKEFGKLVGPIVDDVFVIDFWANK